MSTTTAMLAGIAFKIKTVSKFLLIGNEYVVKVGERGILNELISIHSRRNTRLAAALYGFSVHPIAHESE